jgi:hypothetical protein
MTEFRAFFSAGGAASEARILLWENTIHQVVRLLQEAERRIRTPQGQSRYTTLQGWWRDKKTRLDAGPARIPSETALTDAILQEIELLREEVVLNIGPANSDFANLDLQFSPETPRRQKKGIGNFSKPTDIRIYRLGSEVIDLRIEAKVLVSDGEIAKAYLSKHGLKRFSDPVEPYTDHEIGGMLAYTVSDTRSTWLEKIDAALTKSNPSIPTFRHRVRATADESLFCKVPYMFKATGDRSEVLVFHLVLEFDSDPSARS